MSVSLHATQADLLYFNPTSRPSPSPRPFPAPLIEAVVDLDFHLKGQTMAGHNITFFIILSFEGRVRAFFFFYRTWAFWTLLLVEFKKRVEG